MTALQYKIIKSKSQYNSYCKQLEALLLSGTKSKGIQDEIELLTFLIEKWDNEHNTFEDLDPIQLLHSLMEEHQLKAKDLVEIVGMSKGYISEILSYKKGLSKEVIRALATYFKVSQESFNREYSLKVAENSHFRNARVMNTKKKLELA
ncbi:MAG: transcriptional regulator [Chitinophagaceae bacterium]